tara:strand:+ start:197 stop:448 length:252 start_codon:yes stop_codon:yes gene_type:complete
MNKRATEYILNKEQFEQLKTLYIETIVDSMSMEDLQVYVTNDMADFVDKLTEHDLINEINYTLDESMLDEFVTTIKGGLENEN